MVPAHVFTWIRVERRQIFGWVVIFLLSCGCQNLNWRGQSVDDEAMKFNDKPDTTKYINQSTATWGWKFAEVDGLALVTQLDGSGGDPPLNSYRDTVIKDMQVHNVANPNEILASQNTSIAKLVGFLPPGAQKGDRFDVEVQMFPNCGSSLRGGFVMQSMMRPIAFLGNRELEGRVFASAKGRILVDAIIKSGDDSALEKSGVILGGGLVLEDRPIGLALKDEFVSIKSCALHRGRSQPTILHLRCLVENRNCLPEERPHNQPSDTGGIPPQRGAFSTDRQE